MADTAQHGTFSVTTKSVHELVDITPHIEQAIADQGVTSGVMLLFNPHTTAGITINEGADPDVKTDIIAGLTSMVPHLPYKHMEGNSPAHIMASLMGSSVHLVIEEERCLLGTWQKVYFCEFDGPRTRKIIYKFF